MSESINWGNQLDLGLITKVHASSLCMESDTMNLTHFVNDPVTGYRYL